MYLNVSWIVKHILPFRGTAPLFSGREESAAQRQRCPLQAAGRISRAEAEVSSSVSSSAAGKNQPHGVVHSQSGGKEA